MAAQVIATNSARAWVELVWSAGTHRFHLPFDGLEDVQNACDAGPMEVLQRLENDTFRVHDVWAPIFYGLIHAPENELTPVAARELCEQWVRQRPLMETKLPAQVILSAALVGVEDEQPKKRRGAKRRSPSGTGAGVSVK